MWIECGLLDGNPVWINTSHVITVQPADDHTLLTFVNGKSETVVEEADLIARWVIEGKPTACAS